MPTGWLKNCEGVSEKKRYGNNSKNSTRGKHGDKPWNKAWRRSSCDSFRAPNKWWCAGRHKNHQAILMADTWADLDRIGEKEAKPEPHCMSGGTCMVCLQELTDVLDLGQCGHTVCQPCLRDYYTVQDLERYPLHCCICDKRVPIHELERKGIFDAREKQRAYKMNSMAWQIKNTKKVIMKKNEECPYCHEEQHGVHKHERGIIYHRCRSCHRRFDIPRLISKRAAPQEVLDAVDVDICPGCGNGIEISEGCNDVECLCGARFLWVHPKLQEDMLRFETDKLRTELQKQAYNLA